MAVGSREKTIAKHDLDTQGIGGGRYGPIRLICTLCLIRQLGAGTTGRHGDRPRELAHDRKGVG